MTRQFRPLLSLCVNDSRFSLLFSYSRCSKHRGNWETVILTATEVMGQRPFSRGIDLTVAIP